MSLGPLARHGSLQEAYIHGVSPRAVDDLVKAMGLTGTSKSQVSRLCEDEPLSAIGPRTMASDERVGAFLNRPLEGDWPFLWLDATYVKLREGGIRHCRSEQWRDMAHRVHGRDSGGRGQD